MVVCAYRAEEVLIPATCTLSLLQCVLLVVAPFAHARPFYGLESSLISWPLPWGVVVVGIPSRSLGSPMLSGGVRSMHCDRVCSLPVEFRVDYVRFCLIYTLVTLGSATAHLDAATNKISNHKTSAVSLVLGLLDIAP